MNGDFTGQIDMENRAGEPMSGIGSVFPDNADPVKFLIDRVLSVIPESMQAGTEPLSTIATVLAQLYQAQALRKMNRHLDEIRESIDAFAQSTSYIPRSSPNPRRYSRRRHPARTGGRFAEILRDMADAFEEY